MSIYDIKVNDRKGKEISLSDYKDKVLLIVNTATRCGNTKQYAYLEELYEKYHNKGFEILDFPCNQFGGQAPGTEDEIHEFCVLKYNTTFDQFQKIKVNGPNASPLFIFLKEKIQQDLDIGDIRWNFTKFLINKKGEVVARYPPKCTPDLFEDKIRELLNITKAKDETVEVKTENPKKLIKENSKANEADSEKKISITPRRTSARIANRIAKEMNKSENKINNKTAKRKRNN
ncbi:thioredoxin-like protein [Neocallimastix lanati (nom. inval.)]|uniref:Glutathione peroxidase n=1 Tax=Neocallimastix californiae TaxID=1754190 RepID=A0A1Y2FFT6_9FUNG|nr:thioredoxin-like protein [Neocallimastix sp. JGI-2020a]ORY82820.1 thioredoxin-like protein [Neocallimastix californiae]|eukprot:ORY82820.1 thioredoxin-like protein [Neocallimastix californiae]